MFAYIRHVVDKLDQMLGSYGPNPPGQHYTMNFETETSPSGILARSGTYSVKSVILDDDKERFAGMKAPQNLSRSLLT
jgi:Rho GDP-dissociation inhibitor